MDIAVGVHYLGGHLQSLVTRANEGDPTLAPPKDMHGQLGHWAVVGYGINMCSVICSALVIISTLIIAYKRPSLLDRTSLRISPAIASCDIIYSVCQMFIFNNTYMSKLSELHLRGFLWVMAGSTVSFILLSVCLGLQLLLSVVMEKSVWTFRLKPWYEVGSFFVGFLVTHPYMYLFKSVRWIPTAQLFYLEDELSTSRRNVWLIHWAWVFAGIIFLFIVTVLIYLHLSQAWKETNKYKGEGPKNGMSTTSRGKVVRSATLRISGYPIIPIVTQLMVVVGNLMPRPQYWVFVLANILPTFQGTLNFLVYIMNPGLDRFRKSIAGRFRGRRSPQTPQNFNRLKDNESTRYFACSIISQPASAYSMPKHDGHILP